jgi:hypothetical protein
VVVGLQGRWVVNASDIGPLMDASLLARRLIRWPEYDAILDFINGADPTLVASRLREVGRSQLVLTPQHQMLPGHDTLELRISADDGAVSGHRRSQSISGHRGIRIFDRESLEAAVPPEAAIAFARALQNEQLWSLVNEHLGDSLT